MVQFGGGQWIIGIVLTLIVIFIAVTALVNGKQQVMHITDNHVTYSNAPFYVQGNPYNQFSGQCTGSGKIMNLFGVIGCSEIEGVQNDAVSCAQVHNCSLINTSTLFGGNSTQCDGYIDKAYYNITGTPGSYCYSSGLQDQALCEAFGCPWTAFNSSGEQFDGSKVSSGSIWQNIKWIAAFNMDIGLGSFNWIISATFYVLLLALGIAVYMMIPFI